MPNLRKVRTMPNKLRRQRLHTNPLALLRIALIDRNGNQFYCSGDPRSCEFCAREQKEGT